MSRAIGTRTRTGGEGWEGAGRGELTGTCGRDGGRGVRCRISRVSRGREGVIESGKADGACRVVDVMLGAWGGPATLTLGAVASGFLRRRRSLFAKNVLLLVEGRVSARGVNMARAFPGSDTRSRRL
ncbi:uncharacterized protein A4U43_C01F11380 [Asparagus officinalis]|uniref:Uncharacterized protein n=1 Tax=Asparagus officinalis TaxID=4686 RepID=A0A5P1FQ83_ASPOF|nr:uncharacterized protein A4U43_C01F11380 [Asparagus officinalis]